MATPTVAEGAPSDDATVCEIGCGTGAVLRHNASLPSVRHVVGIDPSSIFLSRARSIASSVEYVEAAAQAVPLPEASQDVIVMWTLLAHVPAAKQPAVLAEARRVLRPGSKIVIFDNDVCAWTFGVGEADPIQRAVDALTHAYISAIRTSAAAPLASCVRPASCRAA